MAKFKIGDRVIATSIYDVDKRTVGKLGTIVHITLRPVVRYGINFDENVDGHTCQGNCEHGHGWYLRKADIKLAPTYADSLIEYEVQNDKLIPDFLDLSQWVRLTPKDWKERYKEYEGKIGYFVESFKLEDVDKIILCLCRIEDIVEQVREQFKGGQNG